MAATILAPLGAYTLLLFVIWSLLGYVRIAGGLRGEIPAEYFRVGTGPRPADKIVDIHHHFSNQFEVPLLFYLGCIAALAANAVDTVTVALAWAFVALRVVHTAIVLIRNDPRIRVAPFVLSTLAVWLLWASLLVAVAWPAA